MKLAFQVLATVAMLGVSTAVFGIYISVRDGQFDLAVIYFLLAILCGGIAEYNLSNARRL